MLLNANNHVLATGVTAAGYTHTGWDCKDSDNNTVTQFHDHYNNYQHSCATYCAMFIRMGGANDLRSRVLQQSH